MDRFGKQTSWLELFYDVAYIALVAQLTYLLTDFHYTPTDYFNAFLVGYAIFITWWGTTANRNLQPVEGTNDKLLIQLQMVGAFLMSIAMPGVFIGGYAGFFLTVAAMRALQACMILRMYYYHPESRPVTYNMLEGFSVAVVLWISAALAPLPYHYLFAGLAFLLDVLVPLTRGRGNETRYLNVYHLQERLGLFLMLVIGESMIVVALANTVNLLTLTQPLVMFSGLGLMVALWWLYFEHSDRHLGVRPRNLFVFLHSHALLFGSIILLSVGYKLVLEGDESVTAIRFVTLGALGVALAILFIRGMLHHVCARSIMLVIVLLLIGIGLGTTGLLVERVYETVVGITLLFGVVAVLDAYAIFADPKKAPQTRS
ncbi:MAG: low temperature requirement protein A [Patescibacteria group bacterium]